MTLNEQDFDFDEVERRRLTEQARLDAERTGLQRNEWGQFATPPALARDIAAYALHLHTDRDVAFLEPSCGSGSFFSALLREMPKSKRLASAVGVELDERFASLATQLWGGAGLTVVQGDYTGEGVVERESASLVIANPPYVRHHHLDGATKKRLTDRVRQELAIPISGLAGLYAHFLLLTHRALAPNAVSAWLVPSEFLDVNYGQALKRYLTEHVTLDRIHRFDSHDGQFDDALVTSSVIVFRNRPSSMDAVVKFTQGGTMTAPRDTYETQVSSLLPEQKWSPLFLGAAIDEERLHPRFDEFFRIRRGIATGNNKFFVLERSHAERLGILPSNLRPMLPGPRYLKGAVIDSDADGYPLVDRQLALVDSSEPIESLRHSDPALVEYYQSVDEKTAGGYLVRNRSPWYRQEQREPAPFLITYMGRGSTEQERPFRFILNRSRAISTNMYLLLYPVGQLKEALDSGICSLEAVHEALQRVTGRMLRDGGRVYGGGLHKMEPKELAALDASEIVTLLPDYSSPGAPGTLF